MAPNRNRSATPPTHPRTAPLAMLAAVACLGAASGARAQVVISIDGDCPGAVQFRWEGATPDRWAGLCFALNTGNYTLPGTCQGTVLGLGSHQLQLVTSFRTGPEGSGSLAGPVPRRACSGYLQVIVYGFPCTTSIVVQIPQ